MWTLRMVKLRDRHTMFFMFFPWAHDDLYYIIYTRFMYVTFPGVINTNSHGTLVRCRFSLVFPSSWWPWWCWEFSPQASRSSTSLAEVAHGSAAAVVNCGIYNAPGRITRDDFPQKMSKIAEHRAFICFQKFLIVFCFQFKSILTRFRWEQHWMVLEPFDRGWPHSRGIWSRTMCRKSSPSSLAQSNRSLGIRSQRSRWVVNRSFVPDGSRSFSHPGACAEMQNMPFLETSLRSLWSS